MGNIEFEDYSVKCKAAINKATIAWLYEIAGEIASQATKKCKLTEKDVGVNLRGSYTYEVDEDDGSARIGTPHEAGYWEEYGTGEYALNNDGRKGWWVYVEGGGKESEKQRYYTEQQAKLVAAAMRAEGLKAHATNGRKPSRTLHKAFSVTKSKAIKSLQEIFENEGLR